MNSKRCPTKNGQRFEQTLCKRKQDKVTKSMKKSSISLVNREMLIKTKMRDKSLYIHQNG